MPSTVEVLEAAILRLSAAERARLLDRLVASLDVDADTDAAWDAIAEQREHELESGEAEAVTLEIAIARLEARFPG